MTIENLAIVVLVLLVKGFLVSALLIDLRSRIKKLEDK